MLHLILITDTMLIPKQLAHVSNVFVSKSWQFLWQNLHYALFFRDMYTLPTLTNAERQASIANTITKLGDPEDISHFFKELNLRSTFAYAD